MKNNLFTFEKAPFLTVALFSYSLAFKYFEDFRKALPKSAEADHAFTLFIIFLIIGSLSAGVYAGLIIAERNVSKNIDKNRRIRK
jgi:Mn2+/Fe2+ NRAMP family transporter